MGKITKHVANSLLYFCFNNKGLIILSLIYWTTFVFMLPLKDQAFEDDFAYIRTAEKLYTTGRLQITEWSAAALVFQVLWGTLFTHFFGYSIKALHFSNIFLLFLAVIAFYSLLKKINLDDFKSVIFSIMLFAFPWVFQFTYSYMTDVFSMSLTIIAIFFYIKAIQSNSLGNYFLGSFFISLSFIQRQVALIIPVGLFLILIIKFIQTRKFNFSIFISCFPVIIFTILTYNTWLNFTGGPPISYTRHVVEPMKNEFFANILPLNVKKIGATNNFYIESLVQMGLGYFDNTIIFLSPVLLIVLLNFKQIPKHTPVSKKTIFAVSTLAACVFLLDVVTGQKRTQYLPDKILRYDKIFPYWDLVWPWLIWISRIIWVGVVVLTVNSTITSLFNKKPSSNQKYLWGAIIFVVILFLAFFIFSSYTIFPHIGAGYFKTSMQYLFLVLQNSYFFLSFYLIISLTLIILFCNHRLKKISGEKELIMFLFITTLLNFFALAFYPYNFYQEYVIQLVPFFLIWIALIIKNVHLNKILVSTYIILLVFFSLYITRFRYQTDGIRWELGTQLVLKGVDPYNIGVNWAWRPYWYFESTFAQTLNKYGGDKTKIPETEIGTWFSGDSKGNIYNFLPVPLSYDKPTLNGKAITGFSERYWIFGKVNKFATIRSSNP